MKHILILLFFFSFSYSFAQQADEKMEEINDMRIFFHDVFKGRDLKIDIRIVSLDTVPGFLKEPGKYDIKTTWDIHKKVYSRSRWDDSCFPLPVRILDSTKYEYEVKQQGRRDILAIFNDTVMFKDASGYMAIALPIFSNDGKYAVLNVDYSHATIRPACCSSLFCFFEKKNGHWKYLRVMGYNCGFIDQPGD